MKATITLEGPATFSEDGRPSFRRGVPVTTGNKSVIEWAQKVSFLTVEVLEDDSPAKPAEKPETKSEKAPTPPPVEKAKAAPKKAAPAPKAESKKATKARKKATKKKAAKKRG